MDGLGTAVLQVILDLAVFPVTQGILVIVDIVVILVTAGTQDPVIQGYLDTVVIAGIQGTQVNLGTQAYQGWDL